MRIPNLKAFDEAEKIISKSTTILCQCCKQPLWKVELKGQYGTRFATEETPFPGVPPYSEYFTRKMENLRDDCPFCGNVWFKLIMNKHGQKIAQPLTLEWG